MAKRKRAPDAIPDAPISLNKRVKVRKKDSVCIAPIPVTNGDLLDGTIAPSANKDDKLQLNGAISTSTTEARKLGKSAVKLKSDSSKTTPIPAQAPEPENPGDPDGDSSLESHNIEEVVGAASRPPPVNSGDLPLPWKGRLGYACLNTYLRSSTPTVFSSRTCRIASILENRHPLQDASKPAHPTKNKLDKDQPADIARGQAFVEGLGLANAKDIVKMLKWNDKYGIKFFRLSSEMFPFASHENYGYSLKPFASAVLAKAGRVAAALGHRLTTHPGQFTQLGSPRPEVIKASIRDLEYHSELLQLLKLPDQLNRDAVMILHIGGVFGDKAATLDRFRANFAKLSADIKNRLVLENDDVSWTVHDLLPLCKELNIPLVLDWHHHNILFDPKFVREGTLDIMKYLGEIRQTWLRKGITQKMHYSEPCPQAITGRDRRKHSPRVSTLPPCANDMDLMIEAKDKEQAVFELMRTFKLPGWDTFSNIVPYTRNDENKPEKKPPIGKAKSPKKTKSLTDLDEVSSDPPPLPEEEVGMGGPEGRVYWPPGMEEWLRPRKRVIVKKDGEDVAKLLKSPAKKSAKAQAGKSPIKKGIKAPKLGPADIVKKSARTVRASVTSDSELADVISPLFAGESDALSTSPDPAPSEKTKALPKAPPPATRKSGRAKKVDYTVADGDADDSLSERIRST
ncbi:MAG: UV-damage endonuclease [Trizodia sp. TS-e1964]|nr:MAG: UV-damage endonuclease [Trizodia sp. TS-e1964]